MDNYITGKIIKELRIKKSLTQLELANIIDVSDKTISKWETGKGLPDISLIEPLAQALGVSIIELVNGEHISNKNISSNISCCGVLLPALEEEKENEKHKINCEKIENDYFISLNHPMTKNHYISFIAYITNNSCDLVKLYPEQDAEARFQIKGKGRIYALCNKDGLIFKDI